MSNTKPSYRGLIDAKIIKRTDNGMAVLFSAIRIRDGFNLRDASDPDYEDDLQSLQEHIGRGGKYPALEVVLSADGQGVDVIDGHRRYAAIQRLILAGHPIEYVRIEPFTGNDVDQVQRILTSQENRKLKPLEVAAGYARLSAFGLTPDDIARRVGKTRQHVDQLLHLASAPHAVQQMVKTGQVSATLAMQMVRTHGAKAVQMLQEQLGQGGGAVATGGKPKKITAKQLKPWAPPAAAVRPVVQALDMLRASLKPETRMQLLNQPKEGDTVTLPASVVWELMNQHESITELREKAQQKAREKTAQASQGELVEAAQVA